MAVLGITSPAPHGAGHLWYVRTLFLFVLAALPLAVALKALRWAVPLAALFFFAICLRGANCFSMLYFSTGALVALFHPGALRRRMPAFDSCLLFGVGIVLVLLRTLVFRGTIEIPFPVPEFRRLTEFLMVATILPAAWRACDLLEGTRGWGTVLGFSSSAFFVYCLHPFVYQFLPTGWPWLLRVVPTVVVCVTGYRALRRFAPGSLTVLSGGR